MAHLLTTGNHRVELLGEELTLGEDPANDITTNPGLGVAAQHLGIEQIGERHRIRSLAGTAYPTYLNGNEIEELIVLDHGDTIRVGSLEFCYENELAIAQQSSQDPVEDFEISATSRSQKSPVHKRSRRWILIFGIFFLFYLYICNEWNISHHKDNGYGKRRSGSGFGRWLDIRTRMAKRSINQALEYSPGHGRPHHKFSSLNFSFRNPGNDWRYVRPDLVNPDALVVYGRPEDEVLFVVYARQYPHIASHSYDLMIENLRSFLKKPISSYANQITYDRFKVNDYDFTEVAFESPFMNERAIVSAWILSNNGYIYTMLCIGKEGQLESIQKGGRALVKMFDIVDPKQFAEYIPR